MSSPDQQKNWALALGAWGSHAVERGPNGDERVLTSRPILLSPAWMAALEAERPPRAA